jgi:FkbM family methyltransferase
VIQAVLRKIAQRIRHFPGLEKVEGLWSALRGPYRKLLNAGGGAEILIGGVAKVRMPAEYAGVNWEDYEPDTIRVFRDWVAAHPKGCVLDVGSSVGIFTLVALTTSPHCCVVAFDADLPSLAALRKLCRYVAAGRLQVVRGFVAEKGRGIRGRDLADAAARTEKLLAETAPKDNLESMTFTCLSHENTSDIPSYTLDEVFGNTGASDGGSLLKCDVEGAELLVLRGSRNYLRKHKPNLLLSVHPPALPEYGHSKEDVRKFLEEAAYSLEVIAVDHEEHWWCVPRTKKL